jgi:hypothetical protein
VDKTGTIGIDGWKGLEGPIDAAIIHPVNKMAYFFKGTQNYRYNFSQSKIYKIGTIGADGWKGVPTRLDAAIEHSNGKVYFFKDDNYYRFDFATDKVDKVGVIGKTGWQGLFLNIDAANDYDVFKDKHYYFVESTYKNVYLFALFSGWKHALKKYAIGYKKYEGVPADLDAALTHPTNKRIYLFKGSRYYRYDKALHKIDKIGTIGQDGWKGVPADIDAACLSTNCKAYFFKGNKYYRFDFATDNVDKVALIKDNWKGVPDNLDAAQSPVDDKYYYYDDNIILFYKKSVEYVYNISLKRVVSWSFIPDEIIN